MNKKSVKGGSIYNDRNSKQILIELVRQGYITNNNIQEVRLKLYNKLPERNYTNIDVPLFVKELVCAYKSGKNVITKCKTILNNLDENTLYNDYDFEIFIKNFNNDTIISCGNNSSNGNATIFYKCLYEMKKHAEEQIKKVLNLSKYGSTISSLLQKTTKRKNISVYEERIRKIQRIYGMQSNFLNSFMNNNKKPRNIGLNMYRNTYSISKSNLNNRNNYGNTNNEFNNNNNE